MSNTLTGKTALVTGSSRGLGKAMALRLAKDGARVIVHYASSDAAAKEVVATIEAAGGHAGLVQADLSSPEGVASLTKAVEAQLNGAKLDILVNNAGITKDGLFVRMSDDDWDAVLDLNLKSVFQLTRDTVYPMMRRKAGRIINITSVVGVTGNPGQGNYCASKAGMIGMSKSLAMEIASRNVTVNWVAPGFIETPMTDALNDKQKDAILGTVPAKRLGTGEEVAAAVVFLASNEAAYVTGQTLHVNGGMAMI